MKTKRLSSPSPVTLLGGGDLGEGDLALALGLAPLCIAADGGAEPALEAGIDLAAVIGDMDSVRPEALARVPPDRIHRIAEQDSTDFDKALRSVAAPLVIAAGFTGLRMDHQLSVLNTMVRRADRACLLLGALEIAFVCPPALDLPTRVGDVVSLFPLQPVTGRSAGLEWPIEGLDFAPGYRVGTSNRALGPVRIEMDGPGMICLLPRDLIAPVARSLLELPAHARWPAREEPRRGPPRS
ncbi:thiamine diphosphokinase [Sulfitobacter sp. D35]|uniref:thiamine diphosphokinase n=1 Tax=Sulfitobacter sp. D35 TaxID=3083252 RepID=UPI00296FFC5B|nr:thiamine diphosphokinase [Sulfitobacter sp. D35]MDW4499612.1 thiamine diphosphokinase [Sulfitobacter sp. D35]